MVLKQGDKLYFIGIGGARLSALAKIYKEKGYAVYGSDRLQTKKTIELEKMGIAVDYGHDPSQIGDWIDLVIYTNAVGQDNPQLLMAKERGIPILEGAELLGLLMREKDYGIAVAGTHGKTTTTAIISLLLMKAGKDPTVVIGGDMKELPGNHRSGKSPFMVVEACEFRRSFLQLSPKVSVITNVDWDHPDCFPTAGDVVRTFQEFIALLPEDGLLILWRDDPHFAELAAASPVPVCTFGLTPEADWYVPSFTPSLRLGIEGDLYHHGSIQGRLKLQVPGRHNLLNALAAIAVVTAAGVPVSQVLKYITEFYGVKRRFQIKGERGGILVVDDYAHHPSAITTTLQTARAHFSGRIWCVFQPHLYSRTKHLMSEFAKAFNSSDIVVLADIFAAREKAPGDVSSQILATEISKYHPDVRYLGAMTRIKEHLLKQARPGDLVITMGAGDIWKVGEEYLKEAPADEYATACGAAKGSAQINNPQANDERLSVVQTNETH